MKKNLLLAAAALPALLTGRALAADMPVKAPPAPPPEYNWTGAYLGLNAGGYAAYSGDPTTTTSCVPAPGFVNSYFACANVPVVNAAGTGSMSGDGFTGGGQIGANWQTGHAVLGAELDFDSFNVRISRQVTATYATGGPFTIASSASTNWLFTARARVGWAFNTLLPYVTGGLAMTDLSANNSFADSTGAAGTWGAEATKTGWAVGAGLEWAFSRNWTAKVEYLYVNFGSVIATGIIHGGPGFGAYANAVSTTTDLTAQIARAGVNYKF